jgi:hypothetical protein
LNSVNTNTNIHPCTVRSYKTEIYEKKSKWNITWLAHYSVVTISHIAMLCYFGKILQDQHYVSAWLKKTDLAAATAKMKAYTQQMHPWNYETIQHIALEHLHWKHAVYFNCVQWIRSIQMSTTARQIQFFAWTYICQQFHCISSILCNE